MHERKISTACPSFGGPVLALREQDDRGGDGWMPHPPWLMRSGSGQMGPWRLVQVKPAVLNEATLWTETASSSPSSSCEESRKWRHDSLYAMLPILQHDEAAVAAIWPHFCVRKRESPDRELLECAHASLFGGDITCRGEQTVY